MLFQQTQEKLRAMRLNGMANLNELHQNDVSINSLSYDERFGMLVDAEEHDKAQRRQDLLLRRAKLKVSAACIEDVIYGAKRGLDRKLVKTLSSCQWIERCQHLIITGATGTGKTWLACAFAQQAIRSGFSVVYRRLPRLLEETEIARGDGSLSNFRARLAKIKLLILDDWAVTPISVRGRQDLLELVEDKTGTGSIIITSQLPVAKWHDYINEPTLADAILDRIVHRSHPIKLLGDSMRKLDDIHKEKKS